MRIPLVGEHLIEYGKMADKRVRRFDKTLIPPAVTTEYINAIGMMFSLAALLMKVILC